MATEHVFRTKTGYCHILPDRILLTRNGVVGGAAQAMTGDRIGRTLLIYSAIALFAAYYGWKAIQRNELVSAALSCGVAMLLVYNVIRSWNNSATPVIDRAAIQRVVFKPAGQRLTRAFFEVYFADAQGHTRKRLIFLPGSLTGGPAETERALTIMRAEGLVKG